DHAGTDAVEPSGHPWEATVEQVSPRDGHYHEKGWQDERNAGHCGAHDSVMHVPEIHRELRGQRTGHELRQRQSFLVVLVADPVALLDEIAIHVTDERDRTTKADAAELQEVARKLSERVKRSFAHCDDPSFDGRLTGVSAAEDLVPVSQEANGGTAAFNVEALFGRRTSSLSPAKFIACDAPCAMDRFAHVETGEGP